MLAALPLRDTSDCVKPDTVSENVMVALNAPVGVPDGTPMVALGLSTSTVTVFDVAAVFWLLAASVATFAAMPIVTVPLTVEVIVAV